MNPSFKRSLELNLTGLLSSAMQKLIVMDKSVHVLKKYTNCTFPRLQAIHKH
jgi:hypothetical protein